MLQIQGIGDMWAGEANAKAGDNPHTVKGIKQVQEPHTSRPFLRSRKLSGGKLKPKPVFFLRPGIFNSKPQTTPWSRKQVV